MADLTIEMFSAQAVYDFSGFDCGEPSLNDFLQNRLVQQHNGRILRGYLLLTKDPVPKVKGFYTLSGSCFARQTLPSNTQKRKIPYADAPSVTFGRLAIDISLQKQGYGEVLVTHALKVVYQASRSRHIRFVCGCTKPKRNAVLSEVWIHPFDGGECQLAFLPHEKH